MLSTLAGGTGRFRAVLKTENRVTMQLSKALFPFILLTSAVLFVGCGGSGSGGTSSSGKEYANVLDGKGATFPLPVYTTWAEVWGSENGVTVNYVGVGSGAGINAISDRTVDFGASDAPLTKDGEDGLDAKGMVQWPMLIGGVTPIVNVAGVGPGDMNLSGETLADIFLGKITQWNDPAIVADNPDLSLSDAPITVVHRSDSSGTTWIFTSYLSKISSDWKAGPGWNKSVDWPVGLGGKGNPGVANSVRKTDNSIGYVESTYVTEQNLTYAKVKNMAGNFVSPTIENFQAAAANADWKNAPGFYLVMTNQPGADSWPIAGVTYLVAYKEQTDLKKIDTLLDFANWCYTDGDNLAMDKGYVPMPDNVVEMVRDMWAENITYNGEPVWP